MPYAARTFLLPQGQATNFPQAHDGRKIRHIFRMVNHAANLLVIASLSISYRFRKSGISGLFFDL